MKAHLLLFNEDVDSVEVPKDWLVLCQVDLCPGQPLEERLQGVCDTPR